MRMFILVGAVVLLLPTLSAARESITFTTVSCLDFIQVHVSAEKRAKATCERITGEKRFEFTHYQMTTRRGNWICPGPKYIVSADADCLGQMR